MDPNILTAYLVSVSSVTAVLVQLVKQALIDPHMADGTARDATIRLVSILFNTAGLCVVLATHGQFATSALLTYVVFVIAQTGGSHLLYQVVSTTSQPKTTSAPDAGALAQQALDSLAPAQAS